MYSRDSLPRGPITNSAGVWVISPAWTAASTPYCFQTCFSCGSEPVRNRQAWSIPCNSE